MRPAIPSVRKSCRSKRNWLLSLLQHPLGTRLVLSSALAVLWSQVASAQTVSGESPRWHATSFTVSGTYVPVTDRVDVLIASGGGGGGGGSCSPDNAGGGGGAAGWTAARRPLPVIANSILTIHVGTGGQGGGACGMPGYDGDWSQVMGGIQDTFVPPAGGGGAGATTYYGVGGINLTQGGSATAIKPQVTGTSHNAAYIVASYPFIQGSPGGGGGGVMPATNGGQGQSWTGSGSAGGAVSGSNAGGGGGGGSFLGNGGNGGNGSAAGQSCSPANYGAGGGGGGGQGVSGGAGCDGLVVVWEFY